MLFQFVFQDENDALPPKRSKEVFEGGLKNSTLRLQFPNEAN